MLSLLVSDSGRPPGFPHGIRGLSTAWGLFPNIHNEEDEVFKPAEEYAIPAASHGALIPLDHTDDEEIINTFLGALKHGFHDDTLAREAATLMPNPTLIPLPILLREVIPLNPTHSKGDANYDAHDLASPASEGGEVNGTHNTNFVRPNKGTARALADDEALASFSADDTIPAPEFFTAGTYFSEWLKNEGREGEDEALAILPLKLIIMLLDQEVATLVACRCDKATSIDVLPPLPTTCLVDADPKHMVEVKEAKAAPSAIFAFM